MPIQLDSINTEQGCLQHIFLAETKNAELPGFNPAEVVRSFTAMKSTIENRLKTPSQFGAPGAKNIIDIVTAPGQFDGFTKSGGKVVITPKIETLIKNILTHANQPTHPRMQHHKNFVQSAISVSQTKIQDEFSAITKIGTTKVIGGVYGWNRGAEMGGRFVKIPNGCLDSNNIAHDGIIMGNQFWTLKPQNVIRRIFSFLFR